MTKAITKAIESHTPAPTVAAVPFATVAKMVERTVAETSARVYRQTYSAWAQWCDVNAVAYMDIRAVNVYEFLAAGDTTSATRQRQLSAMRKFAQTLVIVDGDEARRLYEALKVIKAPKPDTMTTADNERTKTALSPAQADSLLRGWSDSDPLSRRNDAMIRLLAFTGLRRSELVSLLWDDIDIENQVIHIRHGKGDSARSVAIMDNTPGTITALAVWQALQVTDNPQRRFVFCGVTKGGALKADKPITAKTVYRVVQATAERADLPDIAPHDIRRTHITEYLASGGTLAGAQAQAGHAFPQTTLGYAQAVDAANRRQDASFRFGAVPVKGTD